jgi:hypothetical protein
VAQEVNERLDLLGGVRLPAGAAAGKLLGSDSAGNASWQTPGASAPTVLAPGNLGSAYTVNFASSGANVVLVATLNANITITLASRSAGCHLEAILTQDSTGGRTVTISDGSLTQLVTVATAAGAATTIAADCDGAGNIFVTPLSSGVAQASTTAGGVLSGTYPNPSFATGAAPFLQLLASKQWVINGGAAVLAFNGTYNQNLPIAHGLGRVPAFAIVSPLDGNGFVTMQLTGTFDATNIYVSANGSRTSTAQWLAIG